MTYVQLTNTMPISLTAMLKSGDPPEIVVWCETCESTPEGPPFAFPIREVEKHITIHALVQS